MPGIIRHGWLVALMTLGGACGSEPNPEFTQVAIHGVREGERLELEDDGTVHLDNDARVYAALVRIGRLSLRSDGGMVESETPVNLDLFERSIVFDEPLPGGAVDTVGLTFPEPAGDGVTPGESLSVFVAGIIDDVPFEYRDASMDPLELSVATLISRVIHVQFDLKEWFKDVEERELVTSGGVILIDDDHNATAARVIEMAIRASIGAISGDLSHEDEHS